MNLSELLQALRARDIELRAEAGKLRCLAAPGALTPELADGIREHKAALLSVLAETAGPVGGPAVSISRAAERVRFELSLTQRRAVVSAREGAALPTAFRLRGPLAVELLHETLRRIVERHAPLRTRFEVERDPPEQEVLAEVPVDLTQIDLRAVADPEERERQLRALLAEQQALPFAVAQPPLFRFHLTQLAEDEHVLFTSFSPLAFDGWSFDVFWQEMRLGYAALVEQQPWPFSPLTIEYADFVAWQRSRLAASDAALGAFWRERLGEELPPLPLPTDRPRPRLPTTRGGSIPFELPPPLAAHLRGAARTLGVTPQMLLLAGLYAFLHRAGGEERILVGTPVEARPDPALESLIGPCVNMLLLPARVDPREPFADFARRLRDECLVAYEHQEYPIERLQVRSPRAPDGGLSPAFQVELSYQQVSQRGSSMGPLTLSQIELASGAATNDLTFWVKDWGERIAGAVEFKADLFDRETVEHWARCYLELLESAARESEQPVGELPLLGAERERVEAAARDAAREMPSWLRERVSTDSAVVRALTVVDPAGELRPFSTVGSVALLTEAGVVRTEIRASLAHDGTLRPAPTAPARAEDTRRRPITPPEGDLETQLVELYAQLLGVTAVGAEDDYFELGGNSLVAVRLLGEVQSRFGIRLPLATLLSEGTPRALARAIRGQISVDACLVPLKASTCGESLFLIHDADGETLLYRNLALRLPPWLGVYGVQPRRAGRLPMAHATISAAARHYVEEIRRVQPRGPYRLGGLCAGGLLAYEMARQLLASGEAVSELLFLDAAPPNARKRMSRSAERAGRFRATLGAVLGNDPGAALRELAGKVERTASWEWQSRRARLDVAARRQLLLRAFPEGRGWPDWLEPPSPRSLLALAEQELLPTRLRGVSPTLYRATAGEGADLPFATLLVDPTFDWQPWFEAPVRVVDVAGGHSSMLQEPKVEDLARQIAERLSAPSRATEAASSAKTGIRGRRATAAGGEPSSDPVVVDVITVSYRTAALVVRSLTALAAERALAASHGICVNAVIVDNLSGDAPMIREAIAREGWESWATVIDAPKNGGFAYGNNLGFQHGWARERVPDYFFLLNPDAMVRPNAVVALVNFLERTPGAASAASRLEEGDGTVWPYAFRFPSFVGEAVTALSFGPLYRLFASQTVLRPMGTQPEPVDWFPGAAMMLRSEVIRQLGGMDEGYFLYYEETDFCLKLHRAGWTNWYVPDSHVMHEAGQSTGVTGASGIGRPLPDYWYDSRRRYFAKNHGLAYSAALDGAVIVTTTVGDLLKRLRGVTEGQVPRYARELARNSVALPSNRRLAPVAEFWPR